MVRYIAFKESTPVCKAPRVRNVVPLYLERKETPVAAATIVI